MRITGTRLVDLAAASTSKNQSTVGDVSEQLTSGLRVNAPSDDPAAWLSAQRTKLQKALSQGAGAAVTASRDRLEITDNALASIGDMVSQIQTLAVQGTSDTYNASARAGLGAQIRGLFVNALDSANVRGNDGEYLLAGSNSLVAPFDATGAYTGDAIQRTLPSAASGAAQNVSIAGDALTASHGVDVMQLLDRVATAMSNNDMTTLVGALPDLATAVKQVSTARTQAGAAMNVLDQASSARGVLEENMTKNISNYVELDTITAASDFAKATQALEVSRAVSSNLIQMLQQSTQ